MKRVLIITLAFLFFCLIMITGCTQKEEEYKYIIIQSGYYDTNMTISRIEDYNNLSENIKEEINKNNFEIGEKYFENHSLVFAHISLASMASDIKINKIHKNGKKINVYYEIKNKGAAAPMVIGGKDIIIETDKNINEINVIEE